MRLKLDSVYTTPQPEALDFSTEWLQTSVTFKRDKNKTAEWRNNKVHLNLIVLRTICVCKMWITSFRCLADTLSLAALCLHLLYWKQKPPSGSEPTASTRDKEIFLSFTFRHNNVGYWKTMKGFYMYVNIHLRDISISLLGTNATQIYVQIAGGKTGQTWSFHLWLKTETWQKLSATRKEGKNTSRLFELILSYSTL